MYTGAALSRSGLVLYSIVLSILNKARLKKTGSLHDTWEKHKHTTKNPSYIMPFGRAFWRTLNILKLKSFNIKNMVSRILSMYNNHHNGDYLQVGTAGGGPVTNIV